MECYPLRVANTTLHSNSVFFIFSPSSHYFIKYSMYSGCRNNNSLMSLGIQSIATVRFPWTLWREAQIGHIEALKYVFLLTKRKTICEPAIIGFNHGLHAVWKICPSGPSNGKNRGLRSPCFCPLSPSGHVFQIAWEIMIKSYNKAVSKLRLGESTDVSKTNSDWWVPIIFHITKASWKHEDQTCIVQRKQAITTT